MNNSVIKTIPQILKDNICTVFNLLNLLIAIALAAVGAWKNILFILVILINTAVGIVQEIKAKRRIERLTLLSLPKVKILKNGKENEISPDEIKKGDILSAESGSEMLMSMKKVTKFTGFFIVPLGVLMFLQGYFFRGMPIECAVVSTSAGLLGMLPKGLVLLISIGFAAGVINLSKKQVLVRELHSLENLAHCDTVCLDKTGTLTEGKLSVEKVFADIEDKEFEKLIASYVKYADDNNSTYKALETRFKCLDTYNCISGVPFSSERKYSSVTLENGQTFVIGAPEKLCKAVPKSASDLMAEGKRVINNLTKSAGVFFIKTIYSVLLCIFCLLFNVSFPFIPIQITLIDAVIEAFPAFFMSFEKNDKKCEESFLQTAVKAALPNGVSVFACCAVIIMLSGYLKIEASQSSLLMYLSVGFISLAGVIKASLPFNPLRGFLAVVSVFGFLCAVALFSGVLQLPHLSFMGAAILPFIMIMGLIPAVCIRV